MWGYEMTIKKEVEFNQIVKDILENDKFIALKYERHHGISRLDHSLHVARMTYFMCQKLHLSDIAEITRAALLHDFYLNKENGNHAFTNHPDWALENANREFDLNPMQQNIIVSHMFPVGHAKPDCKESYLVSFADKSVATYEMLKYKVPLKMGALLIFAINFLAIQR